MHYAGDLRKVETTSAGKIRHAFDHAREEWTDAERRIRQRMRVYPQKLRKLISRSTDEPGIEFEKQTAAAIKMGRISPEPRPIISIHGHDVDEKDLD
jgi:hypothetical protein